MWHALPSMGKWSFGRDSPETERRADGCHRSPIVDEMRSTRRDQLLPNSSRTGIIPAHERSDSGDSQTVGNVLRYCPTGYGGEHVGLHQDIGCQDVHGVPSVESSLRQRMWRRSGVCDRERAGRHDPSRGGPSGRDGAPGSAGRRVALQLGGCVVPFRSPQGAPTAVSDRQRAGDPGGGDLPGAGPGSGRRVLLGLRGAGTRSPKAYLGDLAPSQRTRRRG